MPAYLEPLLHLPNREVHHVEPVPNPFPERRDAEHQVPRPGGIIDRAKNRKSTAPVFKKRMPSVSFDQVVLLTKKHVSNHIKRKLRYDSIHGDLLISVCFEAFAQNVDVMCNPHVVGLHGCAWLASTSRSVFGGVWYHSAPTSMYPRLATRAYVG